MIHDETYTLSDGVKISNLGNPAHMKTNAEVNFTISDADMDALKTIDPIKDYGDPACSRFTPRLKSKA